MNTDNMIFGCVQIEKIREKVYNRKQRYASCVFLKWFTQKEQTLEFGCESAYLPVLKEANSVEALNEALNK